MTPPASRVRLWHPKDGVLTRVGRASLSARWPAFTVADVAARTHEPIGRYRCGRDRWTSGDTVTDYYHHLVDGDAVVVTERRFLATGVTLGGTYYVRDAATHSYKLAATPGGAAVTIGTGDIGVAWGGAVGTAPVGLRPTVGVRHEYACELNLGTSGTTVTQYAHHLVDGAAVTVVERKGTTAVTIGTVYYARDCTAHTFKLAATPGGSAITLGTATIGYTGLTYHAGDYTLTVGEVVSGLYIDGRLVVGAGADGCIVRDCVIRGPVTATAASGLIVATSPSDNARGLLLEWVELHGRRAVPVAASPTAGETDAAYVRGAWVDAIRVGNLTGRHIETTGCVDNWAQLTPWGQAVLEASHNHHVHYAAWLNSSLLPTVTSISGGPWPSQADRTTHNDNNQAHQGTGNAIRGCSLGNLPARMLISGVVTTITVAIGSANRDPRAGVASPTPGVTYQRDVIDAQAAGGNGTAVAMLSALTTGGVALEFTDNIVHGSGGSIINMTNRLTSTVQVKRNRQRGPRRGYALFMQTGTTVDCPLTGPDANVDEITGAPMAMNTYT